jgi:mRNA interferase MazF
VKRGEVWTVAGGPDYAAKPRPVVIVQNDQFQGGDSITVCPLTTDPTPSAFVRVEVAPKEENGLRAASRLMVDKLTSVPKNKLGRRVGRLDDETMVRLNRAMLVFLGLAG